jgi:putative flippase GtrA
MHIARRFLAFAAVGTIATAVQYAVLAVLVELAGWRPPAASALGFCVSVVVNYGLNHHFTFGGRAGHRQAAARFLLVAAVGLGVNTAVMLALVPAVHYLLAQVLATALALAWNFAASHLWAFRAPPGGAAS